MARRRRPLVADAQTGQDMFKARLQNVMEPEQAKYQAAEQLHIPLQKGYNGHLTAHDAGKIGGQLGGQMVKELVRSAMTRMAQEQPRQD